MSQDRDVMRPRPNPLQPFQCGFSEIGSGCLNGPSSDGQCCQVPSGGCDTTDCGSDCTNCGKCQVAQQKKASCEDRENFKACIPIRTHWYWRNMLALNLAILAAGVLLVCMSLPNHEKLFVPGDLSRSHSQILENTLVADRCSLCHANAHGDVVGRSQEQLCMNCHNSHMPDAQLGNPHDLSREQFSTLIAFHNSSSNNQLSLPKDHSSTKCAQCHVEHHGGDRDLKAITDARCQACHQQQFSSFSSNHPEFRSFPYDNTRRIAFDHVAHMEKYYSQKNTAFDCKLCHELDSENSSQISRTVSFERACASCHQQPLQASSADGWAILQLPSLNASDLSAGGELLTNWPSGALYGYDGKVTLPMRLLLSSDPKVGEAFLQFVQGDLSRVQPGNAQQQAAARTIAQAVRQLLRDTALQGQDAWKQRLTSVAQQALNREPTAAETQLIRSMVMGLPPDLFRQMETVWFGKSNGIADSHTSRVAATLVTTQDLLTDDEKDLNSESADDLLRSSSTQGLNYQNQSSPLQPQPKLLPAGSLQTGAQQPNIPQPSVQPPSVLRSNNQATNRNDSLDVENDELSADELLKMPSANPGVIGKSRPGEGNEPAGSTGKLTATKLVGEGGWYLDSQLYSLKYMPSGHADKVVSAWVQFAALIDSTRGPAKNIDTFNPDSNNTDSGHSAATEAGLRPWHTSNWKPGSEAVGGCTECHLLPVYSTVALTQDDWRTDADSAAKPFTKFSHKPHMTLAVTADCKHCHQFDSAAVRGYAELTKSVSDQSTRLIHYQNSQQHFGCEFKAMEKSQCNACHRAGGASEGCTQCHNYHIGTSGFEAMKRIQVSKQ